MKILYGTTNPAKIEFMQKRVASLGIEVLSLNDVDASGIEIDESGNDPLENAQIKALAYYEALKIPVFSCDSGLYFDEVEEDHQPGLYVRRVENRILSDSEMTKYYANLAQEYGGKLTARYRNAICLIMDEENIYEHMADDIASEPFLIVSKPHDKRTVGFPLDCLSVEIESGKYYNDLERIGKLNAEDGFAKFFERVLLGKLNKAQEKVLVSACLMGEACRYDGNDNLIPEVAEKFKNAILCCPEVLGGLSTPRTPAEIIDGSAEDVLDGKVRVMTKTGDDVTDQFLAGAYQSLKLAKNNNVSLAVLKERSPSCGSCFVYDGNFDGGKIAGMGVTTALLRRHGIRVHSEENFEVLNNEK